VQRFLVRLSELFELYIYTAGDRKYACAVRNIYIY